MLCEIMLSAALFAAGQGPPLPAIPLTREAVLPPDVYLVKAHALTATRGGKKQPTVEIGGAPFEIDHVYVGPGDLKGKTFHATAINTFVLNFSMTSWYDVMPIQKGELGIWWIYKGKQKLASVYGSLAGDVILGPPLTLSKTVFIPALKDGSKVGDAEYEMAVARAEVFEKIYHASDKDRMKVIDAYVHSHDSIKGAAALMLLLRRNNPIMISKDMRLPLDNRYRVEKFPKIADYVLPFSKDKSLSPRVQWEVERLLADNRDGWKDSPEEWQMMKRWYTGTWKEKDNLPWEASEEKVLVDLFVSGTLFNFPDPRPLTFAERLDLAVAGLANGSRSDRFKAELIQSFKPLTLNGTRSVQILESPADTEKGFAFLVQTIRKDAVPARKIAAAKLLVIFAPLSAELRATLENLAQEKHGEEVTKELKNALERK